MRTDEAGTSAPRPRAGTVDRRAHGASPGGPGALSPRDRAAPEDRLEDAWPDSGPELTFPDLPRLELDQLLAQLVDRAHEVLGTQGRLRGLLRATQMVTSDLALPVVLRRIVEAARDLVGARYAALGVVSPDGGLAEFVHVGMPAETLRRIGSLPDGKGLLGALIDELRRIADDERSTGSGPAHPVTDSFLGVPIRVRDEVFGNLYLAESARGEFSAEDEELVTALAATAAVAVENARLYESARSRGEWLQAVAAITRQVLAADLTGPSRPLQLIAETSLRIARADLVAVALPDGADGVRVEVAVGAGADFLQGRRMPLAGSLSGQVLERATPLRSIAGNGEAECLAAAGGPQVGPVVAVPLLGSTQAHGVLWLARHHGRPAFVAEDVDMAAGFANQAAVAIELAAARAEQQRAMVLQERDRIAADLHDHVIQRLFAAGLTLQGAAAALSPGPTTDRIVGVVGDLDDTIRQIRTTIFRLHEVPHGRERGLRGRLLDVAADLTPALGGEPTVRMSGLLDILPEDLADDVVAVVREALTNVARHAAARSVEVEISTCPERVTVEVRDDGTGLRPGTRRGGLDNLRRRAERRGGRFEVAAAGQRGTRLHWSVPTG